MCGDIDLVCVEVNPDNLLNFLFNNYFVLAMDELNIFYSTVTVLPVIVTQLRHWHCTC